METESKKWFGCKRRYTQFLTHLQRNWINVVFHEQVIPILENQWNTGDLIVNETSPVGSDNQARLRLRDKNLLDFIKSSTGAGSEWAFEWTLVSSIALFEAFASDIAALIYRSNPQNFLSKDAKIDLELVLKCETTEEIIEKCIEKKLMRIFYGNPRDAFTQYDQNGVKDGKLNLDTGSYLNQRCATELQHYVEMSKRRNLIVHNAGLVNDVYDKDVPDGYPNKLALKRPDNPEKPNKVKIDREYLFQNMKALYVIARFYTIKAVHTATIKAEHTTYRTGDKNKDDKSKNKLLEQLEKEFK